jgi:hypothetical protein
MAVANGVNYFPYLSIVIVIFVSQRKPVYKRGMVAAVMFVM